MRVTQKDIADRLNLSQSAVTKVLNNKPGVWISDENRRRIHSLAQEMNYRPNAAARSLRNGRYNTVTFTHLRSVDDSSRTQLSLGVETLAHRLGEMGYELKVKVFASQEELLESLNDLTLTRDSDAVVLWGDEIVVEDQAKLLEERNLPFVVKGRFETDHPNWLQVDFDHEAMTGNSVQRLAGLGHCRIGYLGSWRTSRYNNRLVDGYENTMNALGCPVDPAWIAEGDSSVEFAEAAMERWLTMPAGTAPTAAVVGTGNNIWTGIESVLARNGRCVGEGAGEFPLVGTSSGGLTLLFGHGMAYQNTALHDLADQMYTRLLAPLITQGGVGEPVIRILPELTPVHSLEQLRYVSFRR